MGKATVAELHCHGAAICGPSAVILFDTDIAFESDGTAVVWASLIEGGGSETRFALCITRAYAERTWRIRYSEAGVTTKIWVHIEQLRELVARELADGKTGSVLL